MKRYALTICQPWAWAIVHGPKRIENRTWPTRHRGPIAIHAGKSKAWLCDELPDGTAVPTSQLVFGAVIGIAHLEDVVPVDQCGDDPFAGGPWCWRLKNVIPLVEPVPCRGAQGLWIMPQDVLAQVRQQLPKEALRS